MIIIDDLICEIKTGKIKKDVLANNSVIDFSGEIQAMYFSKLRSNMMSETAQKIMTNLQDNRSLKLLNDMRG